MSPCVDQIDMKMMESECISKQKSNGIPMKTLLAQELSKEVNSGNGSPNLVAKLMGLNSFPNQQPGSINKRNFACHQRSHSEICMSKWEQRNGIVHVDSNVGEIWRKSLNSNQRDKLVGNAEQRQMAFVCQKFIEAKRLSMDEKLRQSKQFKDALEVLSSNKELFLKCLQEPNSVFSQQLDKLQSFPSTTETKCITVLRPSKNAGSNLVLDDAQHGWKIYEGPAQPTRIVVLKPSNGKISETSRRHFEHLSGSGEDCEKIEYRAVAKAITEQMRNKLGRHRQDEKMISSVFSNGYLGDESSFNKSETGFASGNLSDSEAMSPASRNSCIRSPFSSSSFSGFYSPESSVCREAKKRLSERWAMKESSGSVLDQRNLPKTTSTLGDMLAISEPNKKVMPVEEKISAEPMDLKSLFLSESRQNEDLRCSQRSLVRSKSVPLSSTSCETTELNSESSVSDKSKPSFPDVTKTISSGISSFRGKFSSLFSSRNNKTTKGKTTTVEVLRDTDGIYLEQDPEPLCITSTTSSGLFPKLELNISHEPEISATRPTPFGIPCKNNQNLESPISVLDIPFEETEDTAKISCHLKSERLGSDLPFSSKSSHLIEKSPPIGSIARILSWDDSCIETSSTYPKKSSLSFLKRAEAEEEWSFFLNTLLSVTGLQGVVQSSFIFEKWHSPDSPLDLSLRDRYIDLNDKGTLHEAKLRQKRSTQKLVFDCVNAALLKIASGSSQRAFESIFSNKNSYNVLTWINSLFNNEIRCCWDEFNEESTAAVESVVRTEVIGNGWSDKLSVEMDLVGIEIGAKLVEELVEETVMELTGKEA